MSSFDFILSILKMLTALALVLGLMVAVVYFLKKFMGGAAGGAEDAEHIKILSTRHVDPKNRIVLLDVLGNVFVVGISPGSISLLTEVVDEKSLERLKGFRGGAGTQPAFMDHFTLYKRKLRALSFVGKDASGHE